MYQIELKMNQMGSIELVTVHFELYFSTINFHCNYTQIPLILPLAYFAFIHGKNKYWEIYMTECSTFRYVQKLLKTRSTVLVQLDQ